MNTLTIFSSAIGKILAAPLIGILTLAGYSFTPQAVNVPNQQEYQKEIKSYIDEQIDIRANLIKIGAAPDYIAGMTYFLAGSGVSSSATSFTLTSLTITQTGQKVITGDLVAGVGNKFYLTIDPGDRSKQEGVSCTTVTQNSNGTATLSGCSRGLSPITPYTASTTLSFVHGGGSKVIFGNLPNIYRDLVSYIDAASIAGSVDSSLTAKGIVEKATASEAASNAGVGSGNTTAPLVLTSDIASSSRVVNAPIVVVASSTTGFIDRSFLSGTTSIPSEITLTGTTTMATTTINGYKPWGLIAATTTTVSGLASFSLSIPPRQNIQVYITASTSVGTQGGFKYTFNGDTGTNYRVGRHDNTNYSKVTLLSASSSLEVIPCPISFCGQSSTEYVKMDIMNLGDVGSGRSAILLQGMRYDFVGNSSAMASTTEAFYFGSAKIGSIEVVAVSTGVTIGAGTQVRVYGELSSP